MRRAGPIGIASVMAVALLAKVSAFAKKIIIQEIDGDGNISFLDVSESNITINQGIDLATLLLILLLHTMIMLITFYLVSTASFSRILELRNSLKNSRDRFEWIIPILWPFRIDKDIRILHSLHAADRWQLKAMLGNVPIIERYKLAIHALNVKLSIFFGPPWSMQSYNRCLQLSILNSITLFFLTWMVSGQVPLGSVPGFEENNVFFDRFWRLAVISSAIFAVYLIILHLNTSSKPINRNLYRNLENRTTMTRNSVIFGRVAAITFAASFAFGRLGVFADIANLISTVSFAVAVAAAAFTGVVYVAVTVCTVAVAVAVAFSDGIPALAISIAAFGLILPIFNAHVNWVSWTVTRFFLARAAKAKLGFTGAVLLCLELFLDLIAAAIFLALLAFSLPAAIELISLLFILIGDDGVHWATNLEIAIRDPWGLGLFVTGMLVTTFIPTILHSTAGLSGIFFSWSPESRALRQAIPYDSEKSKQKEINGVLKLALMRHFQHQRLWFIPALFTTVLVLFGMWGVFGLAFEPFGQLLEQAAYCGGAVVNNAYSGRCPLW